VLVRDATEVDVLATLDLFNALIPTTTVAWRDHCASTDEHAAWFAAQRDRGEPVLVAEDAGQVVGYCCWSTFRGGDRFPGYRHTVELTIHVRDGHQGKGVGSMLLRALVGRARQHGVHVMVAAVDADNFGSIDFHRALGFTEVARMPETGRKFGRWLDLVLMQRIVS
jgi:L-amino acid N-acyltransferase YncA